VTALVSWLTVFVLLPVTPRALAMRSPDELEREILARTQAETELRAAHDTLEQRVVERTTEIQTLNQQLQRSMAETHHRVKNNLQVIAALVDMEIVRGEHTVSIDEMRRLGQHIRSLAVIHDLLTLRAKTDPGIDTLSVKEAMEKLLPILQDMSQTRTIRANIEDARLPVRLGSSLAGLVNELVSNAIKHGKGTIEISFHVPSGEAHLEVSDEGQAFRPILIR
jgi:two-component sensor histidine kinase